MMAMTIGNSTNVNTRLNACRTFRRLEGGPPIVRQFYWMVIANVHRVLVC